jgi:hypothetical protein
MKKVHIVLSFLMLSVIVYIESGCNKSATVQTPQLTAYLQLQPGKYITYRLDSLEFTNFGTVATTTSYQARDIVDTLITDNLGRPSWRVIRYLRDTSGTTPWTEDETYMVTATRTDVEVVENNMRFIKLVLPIVNGYNWPGNSYIDVTSDTFNVVNYLANWSYTYANLGMPYTTLGGVVANSVTVNQRDETIGDPSDSTSYSERNYSIEVYGQGIGLIYKNFLHKEFQPPNGNTPVSYTLGYGITLNMIDHN